MVDLDNYGDFRSTGKGGPKQHHISLAIEQLIYGTCDWVIQHPRLAQELHFRFYSGWYHSSTRNITNDRYSMVTSALSNIPGIYKKIRLNFKIIDSLAIATEKIFFSTVQSQPFRTKIRIREDSFRNCKNTSNCSMKIAHDWLIDGCAQPCGIKPSNVLEQELQKTIDTSIVCDMIHYASSNEYEFIGIVSGDYDLIPGIVYALRINSNVVLFRKNEDMHYDNLITDCEIVPGFIADYSPLRRRL